MTCGDQLSSIVRKWDFQRNPTCGREGDGSLSKLWWWSIRDWRALSFERSLRSKCRKMNNPPWLLKFLADNCSSIFLLQSTVSQRVKTLQWTPLIGFAELHFRNLVRLFPTGIKCVLISDLLLLYRWSLLRLNRMNLCQYHCLLGNLKIVRSWTLLQLLESCRDLYSA